MTQTGSVAGRLGDWISLGVLAACVPRDAVDEAVRVTGKAGRRKGGKLPPHVMVYFAMALALFAEEDYEEVWVRLAETLADWGCWGGEQGSGAEGGDHPGAAAARARAGAGDVRSGRGTCGGGGYAGGVPGAVAADEHRRAGMGRAGHGAERRRVRLSRYRGGHHPGRVSQGQGRDGERVRVARAGAGRDRAVHVQGQRRAVPGPDALPAAGRGLAADRRPELL